MALAAKQMHSEVPESDAKAENMADWFEVYYQDEPANKPAAPAGPEMTALEQMYAYY
ncbi:hypothetical protein [uncultured Roseovarius sp.]|uniref:hypothetical protein n=1 Tax=Roseovarius pacificus TaxID=337701 RepID=UPI0025982DEA|nr:hypothetical protein [uncultured Roseovarius sp.]MDW3118430.1 hypothetical protein [Roseovarius pacificus]